MNCNLSEQERKTGVRCRSFDCIPCKEHLSSKDRSIIDNEIIKMLMKENKRLELEVKHGCSICALQPDITIRDLESKLKAQQELIDRLEKENKELKECAEFYGNPENWITRRESSWDKTDPIWHGDSELILGYRHPNTEWIGSVTVGGKLEVLQLVAKEQD